MTLEVKGQGEIYLISLKARNLNSFIFLTDVHFEHNDCLWCTMIMKVLDCGYDMRVKSQGQVYLKSVLRL